MTESISANSTMSLDCHIENDSLRVRHAGTQLTDELQPVPTGTKSIAFTDFEHEGNLCRVNVYTIGQDGTLEPWARAGSSVSWQLGGPNETYDLHIVVLPVAHAPASVTSARALQTVQPNSWHTLVRVHVPTDGTRPGG